MGVHILKWHVAWERFVNKYILQPYQLFSFSYSIYFNLISFDTWFIYFYIWIVVVLFYIVDEISYENSTSLNTLTNKYLILRKPVRNDSLFNTNLLLEWIELSNVYLKIQLYCVTLTIQSNANYKWFQLFHFRSQYS